MSSLKSFSGAEASKGDLVKGGWAEKREPRRGSQDGWVSNSHGPQEHAHGVRTSDAADGTQYFPLPGALPGGSREGAYATTKRCLKAPGQSCPTSRRRSCGCCQGGEQAPLQAPGPTAAQGRAQGGQAHAKAQQLAATKQHKVSRPATRAVRGKART